MKEQLEVERQKAEYYRTSRDLDDWKTCHQEFVRPEKMPCRFRPLMIIRGECSYLANVESFFKKRAEYEKVVYECISGGKYDVSKGKLITYLYPIL